MQRAEPNMNLYVNKMRSYALRQAGVSLIELLIAITIMMAIMAAAFPSFTAIGRSGRMASVVNEFIAAVQLARNEASNKARLVTVVANSIDSTNEFGSGWSLWIDQNKNNQRNLEETLREYPVVTGGYTLNNVQDVKSFSFGPSGYLMAQGGITSLQFHLCSTTTNQPGRLIRITATGRIDNSIINPGTICP